ncbi:acyltransferase [Fontimonas sp. SYSU GA230001]|uniref:acyltransferase family protein n=1 Tax=Fontimonas sp. SYSU GA230001 TaxID=3142450 RepID=UPI0032B52BD2
MPHPRPARPPASDTSPPLQPPSGDHLPELDGLRAIAVLMVLLLHTKPAWFFWGWAGVDLFLVLSGFLITRILLVNRGQPGMLWSFYGRRALRIWPVYYLTLLATALIYVLAAAANPELDPGVPAGHWLSLVFLQQTEQYFGGPARPYIWFFAHSWSVAVEEQFYLIWPLLLIGLAIRPSRLALLGAIALGAACIARAQGMSMYLLLTRIDGLILGAAVAFSVAGPQPWLHRVQPRHLAGAALVGALLVGLYLWEGARDEGRAFGTRAIAVPGFALLFTAALCTALQNIGHRRLAWLRSQPLRWVGRISYGLYMYHVPVHALVLLAVKYGWFGPIAAKLVLWAGSFALAHVSYEYFEKRILALRRALPYRSGAQSMDGARGALRSERSKHAA